jgi:predicted transcriptional regulator
MLPLKVFHCHNLTRTDIFVWMAFREKETLPGWIHCTKEISNRIGLGHGTVLKCIKTLCDAGFLRREPKCNGDFGYIYSIPNEYLCLDGDDLANYSKEKKRPVQMSGRHARKRLEREMRKNFSQNSETIATTATANITVVKTATNNNINNNQIRK